MSTPQYDFFAQYERIWDQRSSTSSSAHELPLTSLPQCEEESDANSFVSEFELPSPVIKAVWVIQDRPTHANDQMATAGRPSRFVERFDVPSIYTASTLSPSLTWSDSGSTLVDADDDDHVSIRDTENLGGLGLMHVDSHTLVKMPKKEKKGGLAAQVRKVVKRMKRVWESMKADEVDAVAMIG